MRIILVLFICIIFTSCNKNSNTQNSFNELKHTVWIDSLCYAYHFKDSTVVKRLLFEKKSITDQNGRITYNDTIKVDFFDEDDEIDSYYLKSKRNGKLTFKSYGKYNSDIILFKEDSIHKTELEIKELKLKVRYTFLTNSYAMVEFTITNDKKIKYRRGINNYELETAVFSDSTFNQLNQYLEILQLDKYEDEYVFPGFDGTNHTLEIKTNLYSKTIKCRQHPTEGIRNLISFIYYKLQTETNFDNDNID